MEKLKINDKVKTLELRHFFTNIPLEESEQIGTIHFLSEIFPDVYYVYFEKLNKGKWMMKKDFVKI